MNGKDEVGERSVAWMIVRWGIAIGVVVSLLVLVFWFWWREVLMFALLCAIGSCYKGYSPDGAGPRP